MKSLVTVKMSKKEALELWIMAAESEGKIKFSTICRLFDAFGGVKSKLYREHCEKDSL